MHGDCGFISVVKYALLRRELHVTSIHIHTIYIHACVYACMTLYVCMYM